MTLSLFACDKDGNPLLSALSFKCEIDGVKYKDQMPLVIPPGAKRSPIIHHVIDNDAKYIHFSSSLKREENPKDEGSVSFGFRIPMDKNIVVGKTYNFIPIDGKEILEGIDNLIYLEGSLPFVRLLNVDTFYYGNGTVVFTEFDLESKRARGKVQVTFPSELQNTKSEVHLNGEFFCQVQRAY
ncbi:hypothetical protein [Sphingobacterium haloxyli]|nr:hypothetical protein [Sphingobacterium haloxyli]